MPNWVLTLRRSDTMQTISPIFGARDRQLSLMWNRPGQLTFSLPIDDQIATQAHIHSTCVLCERDGVAIWSGPIFGIEEAVPEDTVRVTCLGWLEELNRRFLRAQDEASAKYTGLPGGAIALDLIAKTNAHTSTDGTPRPTRITPGVANDTQVRDRTYKRGQNIGAAIKELSDIENGFDLKVDPYTRVINTYAPESSYSTRTEVKLVYGRPPNNVARLSRRIDGTRTANRINVQSPYGHAIADADDQIAAQTVMLEDWISVSDVNDVNIAGAYANAELAYRMGGVAELSLVPSSGQSNPYRPFSSYQLGDKVFLSASRGRLQLSDQPVRVFTLSVAIRDDGTEEVTEMGVTYS